MQKPEIPDDEAERLAALHETGLLDTDPEERYDRYTRLVRRLMDVPIAVLSLVDEDRQWFKSRQGLDAEETPREVSFCGHAILGDDVMVVEDATQDARFADNPLVAGDPDIRFYAGCPLRSPDGHKIGTLCVIDRKPRSFAEEDVEVLRDFTELVASELALNRLETTDALTRLTNREGLRELIDEVREHRAEPGPACCLVLFDLRGFKSINDSLGHDVGDQALRAFAGLLREAYRESGIVARVGGDRFAVLMPNASADDAASTWPAVARAVAQANAEGREYTLDYRTAVLDIDRVDRAAEEAIEAAERHMARKKREPGAEPN